jgi:hypothetical protein
VAPHPPHRRHVASPRTAPAAPNSPAAVSGPDAGCRSFAGSTSVTAVTSPLPGAVVPADGRSSLTGSETAGGSVLSYVTSAHLRALSAAEVQSSKSRNPVHTRAHERNLPGRDHTPNSPGQQAPRRAEQDVTPDRVALVLVPRRGGRPAAGNNSSPPAAPATSASPKPISHRQASPAAVLSSRSRLQPALPQSVAEPAPAWSASGAREYPPDCALGCSAQPAAGDRYLGALQARAEFPSPER